jgi:hypothetical protein
MSSWILLPSFLAELIAQHANTKETRNWPLTFTGVRFLALPSEMSQPPVVPMVNKDLSMSVWKNKPTPEIASAAKFTYGDQPQVHSLITNV